MPGWCGSTAGLNVTADVVTALDAATPAAK